MVHPTVSYSRSIQIGIAMLSGCVMSIVVYVTYFDDAINYNRNFKKDICIITNVTQIDVQYNCWADGYVTVTNMPCLKIYVNTSQLDNIAFYRSVQEKLNSLKNELDVRSTTTTTTTTITKEFS
jgi:hypothetical protein